MTCPRCKPPNPAELDIVDRFDISKGATIEMVSNHHIPEWAKEPGPGVRPDPYMRVYYLIFGKLHMHPQTMVALFRALNEKAHICSEERITP